MSDLRRPPAVTNWIDPSLEQALDLVASVDDAWVTVLASGVRAIAVGKRASTLGRYGQTVHEFAFVVRVSDAPMLADRAEALGRAEFAAFLRAQLALLVDSGSACHDYPARTTPRSGRR